MHKGLNYMEIKIKFLFVLTILLTTYLLFGTGIAADAFAWINYKSAILYPDVLIATPVEHYTHMLPLKLFGAEHIWIIDVLKIIYINIFIFLIYKYISLFHSNELSFLLSFIIVMFFLHDGATFWFIGNYIIFSFAFMGYSYYLIENKKYLKATIAGFIGSFVSYASPIFSASISIGFLLKKDFKNFIIFSIAPLFYVIYYIFITEYIAIGTKRIQLDNLNIFKQYALQILTYIDAISVAMILKIYYLIVNLPVWYYLVSFFIVHGILKIIDIKEKINTTLLIIFTAMLLIGLLVLSLTGGYYQMAFSLSNRIVFITTIVFVYVIFMLSNKTVKWFVLYFMILSLFATSSHWKQWFDYQMNISNSIEANEDIKDLDNQVLFVYGKNKSELGNIDHLEFSMFYNINNINRTIGLNKSLSFDNHVLRNIETNNRIYFEDFIYVYFLESNELKKIYEKDISDLIKSSPHNYRHWAQTLPNGNIIKKLIYKVMPSLYYER